MQRTSFTKKPIVTVIAILMISPALVFTGFAEDIGDAICANTQGNEEPALGHCVDDGNGGWMWVPNTDRDSLACARDPALPGCQDDGTFDPAKDSDAVVQQAQDAANQGVQDALGAVPDEPPSAESDADSDEYTSLDGLCRASPFGSDGDADFNDHYQTARGILNDPDDGGGGGGDEAPGKSFFDDTKSEAVSTWDHYRNGANNGVTTIPISGGVLGGLVPGYPVPSTGSGGANIPDDASICNPEDGIDRAISGQLEQLYEAALASQRAPPNANGEDYVYWGPLRWDHSAPNGDGYTIDESIPPLDRDGDGIADVWILDMDARGTNCCLLFPMDLAFNTNYGQDDDTRVPWVAASPKYPSTNRPIPVMSHMESSAKVVISSDQGLTTATWYERHRNTRELTAQLELVFGNDLNNEASLLMRILDPNTRGNIEPYGRQAPFNLGAEFDLTHIRLLPLGDMDEDGEPDFNELAASSNYLNAQSTSRNRDGDLCPSRLYGGNDPDDTDPTVCAAFPYTFEISNPGDGFTDGVVTGEVPVTITMGQIDSAEADWAAAGGVPPLRYYALFANAVTFGHYGHLNGNDTLGDDAGDASLVSSKCDFLPKGQGRGFDDDPIEHASCPYFEEVAADSQETYLVCTNADFDDGLDIGIVPGESIECDFDSALLKDSADKHLYLITCIEPQSICNNAWMERRGFQSGVFVDHVFMTDHFSTYNKPTLKVLSMEDTDGLFDREGWLSDEITFTFEAVLPPDSPPQRFDFSAIPFVRGSQDSLSVADGGRIQTHQLDLTQDLPITVTNGDGDEILRFEEVTAPEGKVHYKLTYDTNELPQDFDLVNNRGFQFSFSLFTYLDRGVLNSAIVGGYAPSSSAYVWQNTNVPLVRVFNNGPAQITGLLIESVDEGRVDEAESQVTLGFDFQHHASGPDDVSAIISKADDADFEEIEVPCEFVPPAPLAPPGTPRIPIKNSALDPIQGKDSYPQHEGHFSCFWNTLLQGTFQWRIEAAGNAAENGEDQTVFPDPGELDIEIINAAPVLSNAKFTLDTTGQNRTGRDTSTPVRLEVQWTDEDDQPEYVRFVLEQRDDDGDLIGEPTTISLWEAYTVQEVPEAGSPTPVIHALDDCAVVPDAPTADALVASHVYRQLMDTLEQIGPQYNGVANYVNDQYDQRVGGRPVPTDPHHSARTGDGFYCRQAWLPQGLYTGYFIAKELRTQEVTLPTDALDDVETPGRLTLDMRPGGGAACATCVSDASVASLLSQVIGETLSENQDQLDSLPALAGSLRSPWESFTCIVNNGCPETASDLDGDGYPNEGDPDPNNRFKTGADSDGDLLPDALECSAVNVDLWEFTHDGKVVIKPSGSVAVYEHVAGCGDYDDTQITKASFSGDDIEGFDIRVLPQGVHFVLGRAANPTIDFKVDLGLVSQPPSSGLPWMSLYVKPKVDQINSVVPTGDTLRPVIVDIYGNPMTVVIAFAKRSIEMYDAADRALYDSERDFGRYARDSETSNDDVPLVSRQRSGGGAELCVNGSTCQTYSVPLPTITFEKDEFGRDAVYLNMPNSEPQRITTSDIDVVALPWNCGQSKDEFVASLSILTDTDCDGEHTLVEIVEGTNPFVNEDDGGLGFVPPVSRPKIGNNCWDDNDSATAWVNPGDLDCDAEGDLVELVDGRNPLIAE